MPRSMLLELCQELRDLIYEYALDNDERQANNDGDDAPPVKAETRKRLEYDDQDDQYGWQYELPTARPTPTWLALMKCNRQLRDEVTHLLDRGGHVTANPPTAKLTVALEYPSCAATLLSLPTNPCQIHTLGITLSLANLYTAATLPPSQALAHAVWRLLQRYISHGPHLTRKHALAQPLRVENLRIQLAEPKEQDLVFAYGNPWMQMHSHYSCLKWALGVFARAKGEAAEKGWGEWHLGTIETRFRGKCENVYVAKQMQVGKGGDGVLERSDSGVVVDVAEAR